MNLQNTGTPPSAPKKQNPRPELKPSLPVPLLCGIPYTLQDLWVINLVFSKFPAGCCWDASCNHRTSNAGLSTTLIPVTETSEGSPQGPRWGPQALLITTSLPMGWNQHKVTLKTCWKKEARYKRPHMVELHEMSRIGKFIKIQRRFMVAREKGKEGMESGCRWGQSFFLEWWQCSGIRYRWYLYNYEY